MHVNDFITGITTAPGVHYSPVCHSSASVKLRYSNDVG